MSQWHIRLVWHPDLPRSSGCSDSTFQFSLGSGYEINVRYLANHREPTTLFNVTFPYIFPNWQMDCMLPRFCSETDHKWRRNVVRAATPAYGRMEFVLSDNQAKCCWWRLGVPVYVSQSKKQWKCFYHYFWNYRGYFRGNIYFRSFIFDLLITWTLWWK